MCVCATLVRPLYPFASRRCVAASRTPRRTPPRTLPWPPCASCSTPCPALSRASWCEPLVPLVQWTACRCVLAACHCLSLCCRCVALRWRCVVTAFQCFVSACGCVASVCLCVVSVLSLCCLCVVSMWRCVVAVWRCVALCGAVWPLCGAVGLCGFDYDFFPFGLARLTCLSCPCTRFLPPPPRACGCLTFVFGARVDCCLSSCLLVVASRSFSGPLLSALSVPVWWHVGGGLDADAERHQPRGGQAPVAPVLQLRSRAAAVCPQGLEGCALSCGPLGLRLFYCFTAARYSSNTVHTCTHRHTRTRTHTNNHIFIHVHTRTYTYTQTIFS